MSTMRQWPQSARKCALWPLVVSDSLPGKSSAGWPLTVCSIGPKDCTDALTGAAQKSGNAGGRFNSRDIGVAVPAEVQAATTLAMKPLANFQSPESAPELPLGWPARG